MKKSFKSLLSILIAGVMLFALLPMSALAVVHYDGLNYSNVLYLDEPEMDYLADDATYFDFDIDGDVRSGYAQCYKVYLSYGSEYTIEIDDSCENAEYIERTIIVLSDLTGDFESDMLTYGYNFDNLDSLNTWLKFTAPTTGTFYVLSLAFILDANDDFILGSDAAQSICLTCDYSYDYTDLDYSEVLDLDTTVNGYINESDPVLGNMFGVMSRYKGYSVQLQGGKKYIINAYVQNKIGGSIDNYGAIALLNNNLTGDIEADCIVKTYMYRSYNDPVDIKIAVEVEKTGTYKLLFNRYCSAEYPYYGNENTETRLSVREAVVSDFDIYTKQDLLDFNAATVTEEADVYNVNFFADIDMKGEEWSPVNCFYANVLGNGHAITGMCEPLFDTVNSLYIYDIDVEMNYNFNNSEEYCGFKAAIACDVYGILYMSGCNATGSININAYNIYDIAGFVADAYGISVYVEDCTVDVDMQLTAGSGVDYIGGAFSYIGADGYIGNVEYTGNITVNSGEGSYCEIGGFVGDAYASESISFENCSAKGTVIAMAPQNTDESYHGYYIGGFVGYIEDYTSFTNCFAEVSVVTDKVDESGGFAGYIDEANSFTNCYAAGSIVGDTNIGGFVGVSRCCGYNTFINCYALGDVTGNDCVGGFIGEAYDGDTFINCYAAGKFAASVELYKGGFIGYGEANNDAITFDHCYAASTPAIGCCEMWDSELGEYVEITEGVEIVDFADEDAVLVMEKELNDNVQYLTKNEGVSGLLKWGNRNVKGGPDLIFPCEHVYPGKFNGYDENNHWYICTNPDCTNPNEKYMENDHVTYWVTVKDATETEEGLKKLLCEKCDYCLDEQVIPKLGPAVLGDVNGNGAIDMMDYILLKRNYFGTFKFDDVQLKAGDVNKSGAIDMMDYILLKRAYFGTFKLQ